MMNMRQKKGFTLIELLIVVIVIGILAMIAYPSFLDAVRKARRADAMDALLTVRLNQEKWRANNTAYAGTIASVWDGDLVGEKGKSLEGYYLVSLEDSDATGYKSTAEPTSKGDQDEDTTCANFILEVDAGSPIKTISGTGDADRCWKR